MDNFRFIIFSKMSERDSQLLQARETFQNLLQISKLLNTGLDVETLTLCVRLCELGVDPLALATVIKDLRQLVESQKAPDQSE